MQRIILLFFFSYFLFNGCSIVGENYETLFDPEYKVIDSGKLDVIVKSRTCAFFVQDADSGAKRAAEFHLRSVVGKQNHRKTFKEVRRYNVGNKICVEMSATALPPL